MNKEELEEFILLIEDRIERVHLSSFTDKLLALKELAILGLDYESKRTCLWCGTMRKDCFIIDEYDDQNCSKVYICCLAPKDGRKRCDCSYDDWS